MNIVSGLGEVYSWPIPVPCRAKFGQLDTDGQVMFLVDNGIDRIIGVHTIGASSKLSFDG